MTRGRVHFVVGMSRCGITPLSRALNLHPDLVVFGESRFFGRCYVEPEAAAGYSLVELARIERVLLQFRWTATVGDEPGCFRHLSLDGMRKLLTEAFGQVQPPIPPGRLFTAIAERIADAEGKRYVLEKTPHHLNWVARIVRHVPGATFVVLLCDPYVFSRFHREHDSPYHPLAAALLWRGYMRSYERAAKRHPHRLVVVDTAELARGGEEALARVQRFFGLEVHDLSAPLDPLAAFFTVEDGTGPADVFWINLFCWRLMRRHGYERRRMPPAPRAVVASLVSLPRYCLDMLPRARGPGVGPARYVLQWLR